LTEIYVKAYSAVKGHRDSMSDGAASGT